jgi:hypothetical protein
MVVVTIDRHLHVYVHGPLPTGGPARRNLRLIPSVLGSRMLFFFLTIVINLLTQVPSVCFTAETLNITILLG